jgi:hypothetical protein
MLSVRSVDHIVLNVKDVEVAAVVHARTRHDTRRGEGEGEGGLIVAFSSSFEFP